MIETLLLLFFSVPGALLLLGALPITLLTLRFRQRASKAVGTVIDAKREGTWPAITVEFEDQTGTKRQGTSLLAKRIGRRFYEVGDRVPILYIPERPSVICIDSLWELWFWPLSLAFSGVLLLVVVLLAYYGWVLEQR
jgi:hypothetical protein